MGEVFDAPQTEMELSMFATLPAIKGVQFDRDVYTTQIKFKDLRKFLETFPEVQRDINPRRVNSIRRYIISGVENLETFNMRFFSAMTVTNRGHILYNERSYQLAIHTEQSKLSINDGQHRFVAISSALDYLEEEFVKSKDKDKTAKIRKFIDMLREMTIPLVIFDGLSESEEMQLFHDLNSLAQRPSRNSNIRLNQTDLFSRMSRELSEENKYLKHYGIEYDKMSIQQSNENTILLTTIYASIKEILGSEYKYNHGFLNERNYKSFKAKVDDTFNKLFYALPPDINVKGKYLIEKSFAIKAISRFICHARNHLDLQLTDEEIFKIIGSVDWSYNLDQWKNYGGMKGSNDNIVFGGGSNGGFKGVYDALIDKATDDNVRRARKGKVMVGQ